MGKEATKLDRLEKFLTRRMLSYFEDQRRQCYQEIKALDNATYLDAEETTAKAILMAAIRTLEHGGYYSTND